MMFSKIMEFAGIGQKKFNCPTCHESFTTRVILDEHKASAHPGVERASWEQNKDKHV